MSQTATHVTPTPRLSIEEQFDPDLLPTAGPPEAVCPELQRFWEFRLATDSDKSFEDWCQMQADIENYYTALDATIADQIDEVWMNYRAKEIARSEKALVKGYRVAFAYFAEVDSTPRSTLAPATASNESITEVPTHKVNELPQASLGSTASPAFRSCRHTRSKKSAYVLKTKKRPLSTYEKRQLRHGTIPAVLAMTPHLVRLELREHIWHALAKSQRSAARHNLARMRSSLGMSA